MSDAPANPTHLLGQQVEVVLSRDRDGKEPIIVAKGKLLAFDDGGEVRLLDDMGLVHYCWPMLEIRKQEGAESNE